MQSRLVIFEVEIGAESGGKLAWTLTSPISKPDINTAKTTITRKTLILIISTSGGSDDADFFLARASMMAK
jgi:hypothetical protein